MVYSAALLNLILVGLKELILAATLFIHHSITRRTCLAFLIIFISSICSMLFEFSGICSSVSSNIIFFFIALMNNLSSCFNSAKQLILSSMSAALVNYQLYFRNTVHCLE
ncbi:hypothetical protein QUC31_017013 [Theobroma cacao]|nr:hypothetical protein QQP08_013413 [Theobroma cacao]